MSKQYIAVGAQWCGYSTKQKDEIDKLQGADNVHMLMCQGDGTDWEEGSWQKRPVMRLWVKFNRVSHVVRKGKALSRETGR